MSTSPMPSPESAPELSVFSRITNVFFSPTKAFADLKRNPSWWAAWLLISVFSLVFVFAMQQKVGFQQAWENQMKSNPSSASQLEKMTPQQREFGGAIMKYVSYGSPIMVLMIALIMAGVLMGSFNFGLGSELGFGLSLAVVFHAMLPGILKSVLGAISLFAGADAEGFDINNPVATNLGYIANGTLFSRADHPAVYTLLSWIDVFGIWNIILMGIGFAAVTKVKRSTAISVVAGWYGLLALIFTALAAIRS